MSGTVLLSGGSGFLGGHIIEQPLERDYDRIFVLTRGDSLEQCAFRLRRLWHNRPVLLGEVGGRIVPVPGDITQETSSCSE